MIEGKQNKMALSSGNTSHGIICITRGERISSFSRLLSCIINSEAEGFNCESFKKYSQIVLPLTQ